ncbi:MAG: NAD(+) synthase [Oligoflexales bacterium]
MKITTTLLSCGVTFMFSNNIQAANRNWLESWLSLVGSPYAHILSSVEESDSSSTSEDENGDHEQFDTVSVSLTIQTAQTERLLKDLYTEIRQRMDIAIIGMSGGADSTLVAALCAEALGPENVISVHMPYSDTDHRHFNARSLRTAKHLKIQTHFLPIKKAVQGIEDSLSRLFTLSQVNSGNLRARVRTNILYSMSHHISDSHHQRARVVGTGNLSEDYIGYDTKGGDSLADFFPLGELFKSEVYSLLDFFVNKGILKSNMIDRTPSAGLWEGQTDEDELGWTYSEMEPAIRRQLRGEFTQKSVDIFVRQRHEAHKHKHEAPQVFHARKYYDQ